MAAKARLQGSGAGLILNGGNQGLRAQPRRLMAQHRHAENDSADNRQSGRHHA
jgi:hypothetical protein